MTYNNIYEYFKDDKKLLEFYDPTSRAITNEQAAMELYHKLIEHSKNKQCHFIRHELGYVFYTKGELISFCIKPEFRNKTNYLIFWNFIKKQIGKKFICWLYNKNTRGINFLVKCGMKQKRTNGLITLLSL